MNVLWSVSIFPSDIANALGVRSGHSNSWVLAMSRRLALLPGINLAIAGPGREKAMRVVNHENIRYYILPRGCDRRDVWPEVLGDFRPDVIHVYGTESRHNLPLIRNHPEVPTLISLQGILTEYEKHYFGGMAFGDILRHTTPYEVLRNTGILGGRRRFRRNARDERAMLRGVRFVEGRSDWDRACAENINPNLEYFTCPRMLREAFFARAPWSEEAMERHTILVHQSHMPLKGLHFMLDALSILTRKYPDVRLYVAGAKMIHRRSLRGMVFTSGYSNYLRKKIEALGLSDRVTFTGRLDEQKMAERIATVNVVAIPSTIENAPNSLAEAMLLGTPCVASFVGGNADMLDNGRCGLLYAHDDAVMLARAIDRIFESGDLAHTLSAAARETALKRHDPLALERTLLGIYESVIEKSGGRLDP